MAILGHDPGTTFGVTAIDSAGTLLSCTESVLKCEGPARLLELADYVDGFIRTWRPELYVLEGYAMGSRLAGAGAFTVGEMGGVIRMLCAAYSIPLLLVNPMSLIKFITGKGVAKDKSGTTKHVFQRWGVDCEWSHTAESYGLARLGLDILYPDIDQLTEPQKDVVETYRGKIDREPRWSGVPPKRRFLQPGVIPHALEHWGRCGLAGTESRLFASQREETAAQQKTPKGRKAARRARGSGPKGDSGSAPQGEGSAPGQL